jgi:excinuclease ABC subunit B
MKRAIDETDRRREIQRVYNEENGITPAGISKPIDMTLARIVEADYLQVTLPEEAEEKRPETAEEGRQLIAQLEKRMTEAAKSFEFEQAAALRDRIGQLRQQFPDRPNGEQ